MNCRPIETQGLWRVNRHRVLGGHGVNTVRHLTWIIGYGNRRRSEACFVVWCRGLYLHVGRGEIGKSRKGGVEGQLRRHFVMMSALLIVKVRAVVIVLV